MAILKLLESLSKPAKVFLALYFASLVTGGFALLALPKDVFLLWLNQHQSPFLNEVFKLATSLCEGYFIVAFFIILGIWRIRFAFLFLIGWAVGGLVTQMLKHITNQPRPATFYEGVYHLSFVPGVDIHHHFSFPSGHTATAFTLFFLLSCLTKRPWIGVLCFIIAANAAISRVYLTQHFLIDIYFGSIFGVIAVFSAYFVSERFKSERTAKLLNYSLMKRMKTRRTAS
jgi:membrane-associated phospholipid phosphatase